MNKKTLIYLVIAIFALVIFMFFVNSNRKADIHQELKTLNSKNITSLTLEIDDTVKPKVISNDSDKEGLINCFKSMTPSSKQTNSYTKTQRYSLQMEIKTSLELSLILKVMKTEEMGEKAFISISKNVMVGTVPGGLYESDQILAWIKKVSEK